MISEKMNTLHGWMLAVGQELNPIFSAGIYLDKASAFRRLVWVNTPAIQTILESEPEAFRVDEEHILTDPEEICEHFCFKRFVHPSLFALVEIYLDIYT